MKLTLARFRVLREIKRGEMTSDRYYGLHGSTALIVRQLGALGYVERKPMPDAGFQLTARGRELLARWGGDA